MAEKKIPYTPEPLTPVVKPQVYPPPAKPKTLMGFLSKYLKRRKDEVTIAKKPGDR